MVKIVQPTQEILASSDGIKWAGYPDGDKPSEGSGVTEGSVTANSFFSWDCESAAIGILNNSTPNQPFDDVNYTGGSAEIHAGPAGVGPRSGSKCIRMAYVDDEDGVNFNVNAAQFPDISNIETIYARWWEYYEGFQTNWPVGLKIARFFSGPDESQSSLSYPYCSAKLWQGYGGDADDLYARGLNHAITNDDRIISFGAGDLFGNGLPYVRQGRWYKHELRLTLNSDYTGTGTADGIMQHWIDDVLVLDQSGLIYGAESKGNGSYANGWNKMWFGGNYSGATFGAPSATIYRYIDDMYLSTTVDR